MKNNYPRRGGIYWVRLDPTDGKEIKKTRPCLIISCDVVNQYDLVIVAPITSNVEKVFSKTEIKIFVEGRAAKIVPLQLRSIDRTKRLGKKITSLSLEEMKMVDEAIRLILNV